MPTKISHDSYSWLKELRKIKNKSGEVKAQIQALKTRHQAAKDLKETGKPLSHYANAYFNYLNAELYQSPISVLNSPGNDTALIPECETKLGAPLDHAAFSVAMFQSIEYQQASLRDPKFISKFETAIQYAQENPAKSFLLQIHTNMGFLAGFSSMSKLVPLPLPQGSKPRLTRSVLILGFINWLVDTVNDSTLESLSLAAKREGIEGDINHGFVIACHWVAQANLELFNELSKENRVLIAEWCIEVANKLLERYTNCLQLYKALTTSYMIAARNREGYSAALRGIRIAEETGFHADCASLSLDAWQFICHGALGQTVAMNQLQVWADKARTNLERCKAWLPVVTYENASNRLHLCEKVRSKFPAEMRFKADRFRTFEEFMEKKRNCS